MKEYQRRQIARWLDSMNGWWRLKAACMTGVPNVDLPDFDAEDLQTQRIAAAFCNSVCPVQQECLAHAIDTGEQWYVWGGTTEIERDHLMRKHRDQRRQSA
jgi:WhiB family redox-sensing transcriptional regulator